MPSTCVARHLWGGGLDSAAGEHVQPTKTELAQSCSRRSTGATSTRARGRRRAGRVLCGRPPRWPTRAEPYVGHDGMRKYYEDVAAVWKELEVMPHEIREVGDAVLVLGRVYGRARADTSRTRPRSG